MIGEPFKEVSPGFLPRTLDQLRAGIENDARRPENRLQRRRLSLDEERPEEPQQSIESALDDLLQEATEEEQAPQAAVEVPVAAQPTPQRSLLPHRPRPLNRGEAQLQRARERFARVFGTREDIQQEDYESPLSTMFNRASDRYRQAEERRATGSTAPPSLGGLTARERREIEEQLLWGVMRESAAHHELEHEGDVWSYAPRGSDLSRRERIAVEGVADLRRALNNNRDASANRGETYGQSEHPQQTLDNQVDRPPPKSDEEMTRTLSCQVCYQQIADIALLPCGHMVMCEWCADVVVPVRHHHVPVRPTKCPMCRKQVKQRFKIHMG